MKLFQYAIIWHPTEDQKKQGKQSEIVIDTKTIIAPDQNTDLMLAGRAIPEKHLNELSQLEVYIRPF